MVSDADYGEMLDIYVILIISEDVASVFSVQKKKKKIYIYIYICNFDNLLVVIIMRIKETML